MNKEVKAALSAISTAFKLKGKMCEWEVKWKFGLRGSSNHESICERQIGTIRQALNYFSDFSIRHPTNDEFNTCSKMAEYVIDCRQLTNLTSDDGLPPLGSIDLMVEALGPRDNCSYPRISSPNDKLRRGYSCAQRIA